MTFYRNHTLNSPSTEMSHLISLCIVVVLWYAQCSKCLEKSAIWGKPYYCLQRPESMFSKQFYKLHIIKVWAFIWYFCTCFKCYNTVISDTYVPPWESRAIAIYGRKYVVQRNRILSTAFYLKKLLNGTPITEMHRGRERGQTIRDLIAEIVEA